MMHPLILLLLFAAIVYAVWTLLIYPVFISPLSKIPAAHPTSHISPAWILWQRYQARENRTVHAAHLRHGSLVRLGPREVSVNSIDGVRTVYGGGYDKSNWYPNQFHNYDGTPCAFSMSHGKPHAQRKRMMSNLYSKSYIQTSADVHQICAFILHQRLLPQIARSADAKEPVNALYLNYSVTMDMITAFIFGLGNGSDFLGNPKFAHDWLTRYQDRRHYHFWDSELPGVTAWVEKLTGRQLVPKWVIDSTIYIEEWTWKMCVSARSWTAQVNKTKSSKQNETNKTPALIYDQLRHAFASITSVDKSEHPCTDTEASFEKEIASEVLDHLAAGYDTSGITLTYLFWELSRQPALQKRLQAELGQLSPPIRQYSSQSASSPPSIPSARVLDQAPLLHAILMETLRLHPAIPGPQPRITPSPTPTTKAKHANTYPSHPPISSFPKGIRISAQAYSLHRNPSVFPDPESWQPSRWLNADETTKTEMMRWFWAFGSGGRMCIGSHFAMNEMKYVVAAVYSNYTSSIVDDAGVTQLDAYTAGPQGTQVMLQFHPV